MMASPVLVTMGDSAADEETRQPLLAEEEVAVQPGKGKLDQGVIAVFSRKGQQIYLGTPRVRPFRRPFLLFILFFFPCGTLEHIAEV